MTDPNRNLIGQVARRPPEEPQPDPTPTPTVIETDWNSPVDSLQADSMTAREIIRGQIANAKEVARRWEPQPLPPREEYP